MSDKVIVTKEKIDILADSISEKSGIATPMTLAKMKEAVDSIVIGGGGITPTGTIDIAENGTYDVTNYVNANVNIVTGENWIVVVSDNLHDSSEDVANTYIEGSTETSYNGWTSTGYIAVKPDTWYRIIKGPNNKYNAFYKLDKTAVLSSVVIKGESGSETEVYLIKTTKDTYYIRMSAASSSVSAFDIREVDFNTPTGNIDITSNGQVNVSQYENANINVPTDSIPVLQSKTITPTESVQIVTADNSYDGLSSVEIEAIDSTYVGSKVTRISDNSGITINGQTVSVRGAAYYTDNLSKQIPGGTTTTPATTITANPSISVSSSGLITATTSTSQNVTPTVSVGYISSGTAGKITVSGSKTQQLTSKAATIYNTSTTDQTIVSGTYLTGTQTIKAVKTSGISAANVKAGTLVKIGDANDDDRIINVTGTFTSDANAKNTDIINGKTAYVNGQKITGSLIVQTIYQGSAAPSASTGINGDIYIQS